MEIKEFNVVKLKDGRTATIVDILEQGIAYMADVGDSPKDWETISIKHSDIEEVIKEHQTIALNMA